MTQNQDAVWGEIAGKLHGELSEEEETEFTRLILDTTHLHEFEKTQQIHDNMATTGPISANRKVESWTKVEHGLRSHQLRWIPVALRYAAVVVVAFVTGNLLNPSVPLNSEIRYSEITVPFGQMSQLKLSDGTKIWLNSGTTLRYPDRFAESHRSVSVEGEAYFEVAKMPDKPFTVNTADIEVEVRGTSFNLSAYKDDAVTSVTLVEGKVTVQNKNGNFIATLSPGQMAIKTKNKAGLDIQNIETGFYAAWIEGKIYFDDEPLDHIAVKLERWFNVEISFADEQLKSHRFTGTILKNKPVDQIMQALELLSPIRFKHEVNVNGKDKIIIYKRT